MPIADWAAKSLNATKSLLSLCMTLPFQNIHWGTKVVECGSSELKSSLKGARDLRCLTMCAETHNSLAWLQLWAAPPGLFCVILWYWSTECKSSFEMYPGAGWTSPCAEVSVGSGSQDSVRSRQLFRLWSCVQFPKLPAVSRESWTKMIRESYFSYISHEWKEHQ